MTLLEIFGAKGRLMINPKSWPEWKAQGYTRENPDAPKPSPEPVAKQVDYSGFNMAQLRTIAASANVLFRGLKKPELIAAIEAVGFIPEQTPQDRTGKA